MVLTGMRGTFEARGLMDGIGDIGFDAGGFLKDVGRSAASGAAGAITKKIAGGGKPPAKPSAASSYAPAGKRPLSTGAKVALGAGGLGLVALIFKGMKGRR